MKYNSSVILIVVVIGSFHRRRAKSPLGTVLIINLLGKGLTPRACMVSAVKGPVIIYRLGMGARRILGGSLDF